MRTAPGTLLACVLAACAAAAPAHAGTLGIEHDHVEVREVSAANGVVAAGDVIAIKEHVISSEAGTVTGLQGSLTTQTAGVSLPVSSSPWPDLAFGDVLTGTTELRAALGAGIECGQDLAFTLTLSNGTDGATIPFRVGTGAPDAPVARTSGDVPHVIPNPGVLDSALPVATPGRVKEVRVRVGRLRHPYVADLQVSLISPAGTEVRLLDRRGGSGDDLVDTTFAAVGTSLDGAAAPFTGTFRADGDLTRFRGEQAQGTWKLRVVDTTPSDQGTLESWGTDLRPATCAPRPIAVLTAGPNPAGVGALVTFDASQSTDPTGAITRYEWDLDGNGSYETDTGATPQASRTYGARQTVTAGLRITNEHGETGDATTTVAITAPPVAAFTWAPLTPVSGQEVTLDASGSSDPDGSVATYEWDLDGNGTYERSGSVPTTTWSFASPGTKVVRLRVTDDNGASAVVAEEVEVANRPPSAAFTAPTPALRGEAVALDAAGSADLDGELINFQWDLDGDGTFEIDRGPQPTLSTTFATSGTRTVGLRVVDDQGAEATATRQVVVTDRPVAALAATPQPARPNVPVLLSAVASSDADGSLQKFEWDLDGNGTYELTTGIAAATTKSWSTPGDRTVRVRVTDDKGATATATKVVSVVNLSPVAAIAVAPSPAVAGQVATLSGAGSSDADGVVVRYEWDLDGNGSYETDGGPLPTVQRTFPNPTTVTVRLRVTDAEGGVGTATLALPVIAPAPGGGAGPDIVGPGTAGGGGILPKPGTGTPTGGGTGAGAGAGVGSGGGGGTSPGVAAGRKLAASLDGTAVVKRKDVAKKGLKVRCVADRAASCGLWLELAGKDAKKLKLAKGKAARKPVKVGGVVTTTTAYGRPATVVLKLTAKARKALGRAKGTLKLTVRGSARDAAGTSVTLARVVLTKR